MPAKDSVSTNHEPHGTIYLVGGGETSEAEAVTRVAELRVFQALGG